MLLLVVLDGVRRLKKRGRLRLDIDKSLGDLPEPDLSAELPNGGARRALDPLVASRGPSFSEEPVLEEPAERQPGGPGKRVAEPAVDDEIDLLMADLKGVGEGADSWLTEEEKPALNGRDHGSYAELDDAEMLSLGDGEAVGRPRPAKPAEVARRETAQSDSAFESVEQALPEDIALAEEAVDESVNNAPATAELQSAEQPAAAEAEASPTPTPTPPKVTLAGVPTPGDDLDLSKPVPELMAQMASRVGAASTEEKVDVVNEASQQGAESSPVKAPSASADGDEPAEEVAENRTGEVASAPPVETPAVVFSGPVTQESEKKIEPTFEEPVRDQKPGKRGRPPKKKKLRRGLPEIQINIFDEHPGLAPEPELPPQSRAASKSKGKPKAKANVKAGESPSKAANGETDVEAPDDVLVVSVAAKQAPFQGSKLFKLLAACDLTFGDMAIFHRHEEPGGKGPIQFSMANAVKPGTFDPEKAEAFSTPAVTFFLHMGEPRDLANAFDCMLATAQCVADNLNGELKDENRSSMRPQTIEHCRQRIRDFERRRLTRRA